MRHWLKRLVKYIVDDCKQIEKYRLMAAMDTRPQPQVSPSKIKLKRNESIQIVFEDFSPSELWADGMGIIVIANRENLKGEDNYPCVYHKKKFFTIKPDGVGLNISDGFEKEKTNAKQ